MISDARLTEIESRLAATSGSSWELDRTSSGAPVIKVRFANGSHHTLRITRESEPASLADVIFVVGAHRDVPRLVSAARGVARISEDDLATIEQACEEATAGPWKVFLEDDGGIGGTHVIWVSDRDNEPDMYLWLDDGLAPSGDFEFVAAARQDIPALIAAIRGTDAVG
jgi:hypothetical protein